MAGSRFAIPDTAVPMYTAALPVRWGDMDAFQHVNNIRFLQYFEQTRIEWLEQLPNANPMGGAQGPVVAHTQCAYKSPLTYPATVQVALLSTVPGRSSIETFYRVTTKGAPDTVVALGSARIVWIRFDTGRPVALPDAVRAALPAE